MKRIQVKINGEWREVIDIKKDEAVLYGFLFKTEFRTDSGTREVCLNEATDIRLVDESEEECEHKFVVSPSEPWSECCAYCAVNIRHVKSKPIDEKKYMKLAEEIERDEQKIEKLRMGFNGEAKHFIIDEDTRRGVYSTPNKLNQLMYKINEIIDHLNRKEV